MATTLAQTRSTAQLLLDNPGTSSISAAQWTVLINRANLDVWRALVDVNPSYFQTNTRITFPGGVDNIDISGASYLNTSPYKLVEVWYLPSDAARSPGNLPVRMTPEPFQEHCMRLGAGGVWMQGNGAAQPLWYTYQGDRQLYVAPIPAGSVVLDVFYVPLLASISSDSDEVLGGRCDEFQDAVAYRAAWLANSKRQGSNPVVAALWAEAEERIKKSAPQRQLAESRRVHAAYTRTGYRL